MTGAVATHLKNRGSKKPFHMAMLIPMMAFVLAYCYPLYVNFYDKERMDVRRATEVGIKPVDEKEFALHQTDSAAVPMPEGEADANKARVDTVEEV